MKAAILSVGTELLFGEILNTNTKYLSQQLNDLGIDILYHYTVGDNPKRLSETIKDALKNCDLILTTGGLGPTQDDMTKEIVAEVLHDELCLDKAILKALEAQFKRRNWNMTENNRKQAYFPSRAVIFENHFGTAPGFALTEGKKIVICMPGPPKEMQPMFLNQVKPYLNKDRNGFLSYQMLRLFGIGESSLETALLELIDRQTDPTLATYAKQGEVKLRIASKRETEEEAEAAVKEMVERVKEIVGDYIYSENGEELYEVVGKLLLKKNITLSCAESCTGGLFAETITNMAGISEVFDRGIVTYSNRAKIEELGVKEVTLERFGAVSEQTAIEMAEGLQKISGSELCIAVTGIAGPTGATEDKPVGLIYLCVRYGEKTICKELRTGNSDRIWNRNYALLHMLFLIYKTIL
ncbi:competence/damage-inducible protein A [Sinanaerobacter sp. ZZT-01]|uniref:competence/damage-inducible protein A n=1 Tax=Sinanaerobacter sp. ZZT-01 TaxID=3111540 RepID=UPI002D799DD6|nr:competence/damage-inducible protein A [Sinanaerobacter sp. ZZT-01]WRR93074.1 competence/damage-inducible protein A [Sinanaerobacter sp. ZZT-01]